MDQTPAACSAYPEWYSLETECRKTIFKLSTSNELAFYLKNPNEYIRRLAIIRLTELKQKDSLNKLQEVLDDPSESLDNKNLSAWAIKTICLKWGIDLFLNNRLLSKYSGHERYEELYAVKIIDTLPGIKFDFTSALDESDLQPADSIIRLGDQDIFDSPFPFREWINTIKENAGEIFRNAFLKAPQVILGLIGSIFALLIRKILLTPVRFLRSSLAKAKKRRQYRNKMPGKYPSSYSRPIHPAGFRTAIGKCLKVPVDIVLFLPRQILRHKLALVTLAIAVYCTLTFTVPGKQIAGSIFGQEFLEFNKKAGTAVSKTLSNAVEEAKQIFGRPELNYRVDLDNVTAKTPAIDSDKYKVVAREGLNLRQSPDPSTVNNINEVLEYNSIVSYLSQSQKDNAGRLWYKVKSQSGNIGWVSSHWLQKEGGN